MTLFELVAAMLMAAGLGGAGGAVLGWLTGHGALHVAWIGAPLGVAGLFLYVFVAVNNALP